MVIRGTVLALLVAAPTLTQVAAPKVEPPPKLTLAQIGLFIYPAKDQAPDQQQFPAAVVVGCIDSRAPAEIIFDAGIGDTFNARIAGNVVNDDLLGSIEFACAVAGAKVTPWRRPTSCWASIISAVEAPFLPISKRRKRFRSSAERTT